MSQTIQERLRELMRQKDEMEKEIMQLTEKCEEIDNAKSIPLTNNSDILNPSDFTKGLVDNEGFPRADLDFGELSNFRNDRRRINELKNDHVILMKQIEKGLEQLHSHYLQDKAEKPSTTVFEVKPSQQPKQTTVQNAASKQKKNQTTAPYKIDYLTPFAILSKVEDDSPAKQGGLESGDLLSEIGDINIYTPDSIKSIPQVVREGFSLRVVVLRKDGNGQFEIRGHKYNKHELNITPQRWSGRGLLGCKIDPIL